MCGVNDSDCALCYLKGGLGGGTKQSGVLNNFVKLEQLFSSE